MRRRVRLYHVWFATKSRKWLLQGEVASKVKELMRQTATEKGIRLLECETMVDHAHLLLDVEDRVSLGKATNALKGVLARRINQAFPELKLDGSFTHFWQLRYGAKEVPDAAAACVANYVRSQWERPEKYER